MIVSVLIARWKKLVDPVQNQARPGFGSSGHPIPLLSNHFKVSVNVTDVVFYQYSVSITAEDNRVVDEKRKIIDRLCQTYSCELAGKSFAYDGEKTLYSLVRLPQSWMEFTVVPKESIAKRCNADGGRSFAVTCERSKRRLRSETFKVEIVYAAKIPLNSLALSLHGNETNNNTRDALRVLDSILKNRQSRWLPLRQTFFHDDPKNFTDVGGGITGVRGYHSSFRTTQGGLSLNMDVTMTMFLTPGPVIDFLKANQNVQDPCCIDWVKAKSMLKNLRVKPRHRNKEYKIIGLSQKVCNSKRFSMKVRSHDCANGEPQVVKITVYEYFTKHCGIELTDSACLPCLDVGNTKQPIYLPIELCTLVPLQRYAKALFPTLRASLVASSRQNPQDRKRTVIDLRVGNKEDVFPRNGRWNFNYKTLFKTTCIDRWAVVVGSLYWPHISRYRASVRAQSPKEEMIDALYNPLANGKDDGMMRKLLEDFCHTSNGNKPKHIIVFRNGEAESQFSKVLNVEVEQILKAYQDLFKSEVDVPKFTVIVAQKDHHTKLFQDISPKNVPSGTVVDTEIVHPRNYDFYLWAHASMIGTSRPAHYHVLLDEIGFSSDELQNLICMGQFMKFEDNLSKISSGQGPIPELPRLHKNVASSMFFY
ncbi:hypothetical protein GH714_019242 [Hevea brasiliensis]|uniref:Piwi domain-containing protein n=1 Tax=Hevea brasiliensis TaxID=3981 RepID=A0A6A6KWC6_HEVBR|nr:hypothetical protein GH714_019242 [Hevea brasiliensis]